LAQVRAAGGDDDPEDDRAGGGEDQPSEHELASERFDDRHVVGETPSEYLTRWRMDLASQRLRDTDDTVAAIAASVGYRSEYSFSRAFARHRGLAPGRYRHQIRARELAAA
jgi:methylphosphotriester-DNA--protein-cysteine methyltransferase